MKNTRKKIKKKIVYTDEPMEFGEIVDFLPPPEMLVMKKDNPKKKLSKKK